MKRRGFLKTLALTCGIAKSLPVSPDCFAEIASANLVEARFWKKNDDGSVSCELCPNRCWINNQARGRCKARTNKDGTLYSMVYGNLSTIAIDPIEKKPVFHVLPGSFSLSISAAGCVLSCRYCQNWQISQALPEEVCNIQATPESLVAQALQMGCKSISYTYNEPTVFYEFMYDTAKLAQEKGLRNIMVSCGYINPEPLKQLLPIMDVVKVDLKGFSEAFYHEIARGRLEPVKQTIEILAKAGKLMDIVCLIVPGLNDDEAECGEMFKWLKTTAGEDAAIFLSRFYPTFKLKNVAPTPLSKLEKLRKLALETGLKFVYLGNVAGHEGENTYCPKCGKLLIERLGYQIRQNLLKNGCCSYCGEKIPGIWV